MSLLVKVSPILFVGAVLAVVALRVMHVLSDATAGWAVAGLIVAATATGFARARARHRAEV